MKRMYVFFTVLLLAYLAGAFYSLNFDISLWESETRGLVVVLGLFIGFAISSFPFIDELFK
jgi:hypothetical protein